MNLAFISISLEEGKKTHQSVPKLQDLM